MKYDKDSDVFFRSLSLFSLTGILQLVLPMKLDYQ